ncbi:MAG: o-succinylbenzoate synthase [Rhodothermales bacterium]
MTYRVHAFRYELPFREPVRTGRHTVATRQGILLSADTPHGPVWSEAAPLDGYGVDTLDDALRALPAALDALQGSLPDLLDPAICRTLDLPPSLAWAADLLALKVQARDAGVPLVVHLGGEATATVRTATLSALVSDPTGSSASDPDAIPGLAKLKVGSGTIDEDLDRIRTFARSNPDARFRLDANGAWTLARAQRFLEGLSAIPGRIDFLEEPLADDADWDALADIADDLGIPLAADESLRDPDASVRHAPRARLRANVQVFKPSLHGSWARLTEDVRHARSTGKRVVFSSAFESGIGMADLVHVAAALSDEPAGFGTHAWLARDLVPGPACKRLRETVLSVAGISAFESPVSVCPVHTAARRHPQGTAVRTEEGTTVTWAELDARIEQACRHPAFRPDVRMDVRAERTPEFLVVLFAAMRRGCILHPADPRASGKVLDAGALAGSPVEGGILGTVTTIGPEGHVLMGTSGSTGAPHFVDHAWGAFRQSARAVNHRVAFGPGHTWAWTLQPHHVGGLAIPVRCAEAGATLCIPVPDAPVVCDHVTHLSLVEVQLARLVAAHRRAPEGMKSIMVGGGALATHLLEEAVRMGFPVRTTYGMTETASTVTCSDIWTTTEVEALRSGPDGQPSRVHAGTPLDGYDVRVDAGGGDGRIFVKTPFADWIRTSDKGETGPGGRLVVTGRLDRTLISGGENVSLAAIEAALEHLPDVHRARVVGVPDPTWGERPVAFVVSTAFDEAGLRNALTAELPAFMVPDRIFPEPPPPEGQAKWTLAGLTALAVTLGRTHP